MTRRRLTVAEAAEALGISQDAVRMRIKRHTLDATKDGRQVFVMLDTDPTPDQTQSEPTALISELRAHNATLREQLESERQAHSEARRIIAGLVERIPPAIEPSRGPSQEATGAPESAADEQQGRGPIPDAGGPETATERPFTEDRTEPRSWWRRVFGG